MTRRTRFPLRLQALEQRLAPATFIVTSAGDTPVAGKLTLREAIQKVNADADPTSTITFNIDPGGSQTITLANSGGRLADITHSVTIDGTTQPLSITGGVSQPNTTGKPLIFIDGSALGGTANDGFVLTKANSTVRGLAIGGFAGGAAVATTSTSTGDVIAGNYLGLDTAGAATTGTQNAFGVRVGSDSVRVGGSTVADRNVISNNTNDGVVIDAGQGVVIAGNYIGTTVNGQAQAANGTGIVVKAGTVTIGGATRAAANVISGNTGAGIQLEPGAQTTIQGNVIGGAASTFLPPQTAVPNGVGITTNGSPAGSTPNTITGNTIFGNSGAGVQVTAGFSHITITGNSISKTGTAIDLMGTANGKVAAPTITAATSDGTNVTITGTVSGAANEVYRVEVFANPGAAGSPSEAQLFVAAMDNVKVGTTTGNFSVSVPAAGLLALGPINFSATATRTATGDTSTLSAEVDLMGVGPRITGHVFIDANADNAFNAGDQPLAGVTVTATNTATNAKFAATADSQGAFSITVPNGSYTLSVANLPPELTGTGATITFNPTTVNVTTNPVTEDIAVTRKGGFITGQVFRDLNNNGQFDLGEPGEANATVTADDMAGHVFTAATDATGQFKINVTNATSAPTQYTVTVTPPAGFQVTPPLQTVTVKNGITVSVPQPFDVSILGGQGITGRVFNDLNGNGVLDTGEAGLAGVTVFADLNGNGTPDAGEPQSVTDANGFYVLPNLAAGDYAVRAVLPNGTIQTLGPAGALTVNANSLVTSNFGIAQTGVLTGKVFLDANNNGTFDAGEAGQANLTVFIDANNNGKLDTGEVSTTTDAQGNFSLTLPNGDYNLRVNPPSGFVTGTSPALPIHLTGNTTVTVNLPIAQGAAISGRVFVDANNNGTFDTGEGKAGVTVFIDANNNGVLDTGEVSTTTDATGAYTLTTNAGNVYVRIVAPTGFAQVNGPTLPISVTAGQTTTANFTLLPVAQIGTVSGHVFVDTNNNGKFDAGEGQAGVTVVLTTAGGSTGRSTTTDANGLFTFANVAPGSYTVAELVPSGFRTTNGSQTITITGGQTTTADFVNIQGAAHFVAVGSGSGVQAEVKVYAADGTLRFDIKPFDGFTGGVHVATGDVNGDGIDDIITGAGPGGGPHVRVFSGADGTTLLGEFFPYATTFAGGVFVAAGDINGDGKADIITGAGAGGGPHVRVFNGTDLTGRTVLREFFPYATSFAGGVTVAAGDVNGDGRADIITGAGPGGGPHVRAFSGADPNNGVLTEFFAYSTSFSGGVFVTAGDINADGRAEIITGAGPGGGPHVRAFNLSGTAVLEFFAFATNFTGGVTVAAHDLTGDSRAEIIVGSASEGGSPDGSSNDTSRVRVFDSSAAQIRDFTPFDNFLGGVFVG